MFRGVKRIRRDEKGATAIEFAMVAPVLIWLMFGIIEFGLVMATQSALEGATSSAARIYKAEARSNSQGATGATIHAEIVRYCGGLVRAGDLRIIARTVTWGSSSGFGGTPTAGQQNSSRSGSTGDVVQYRAFYNYRVKTPFLSRIIGGSNGQMRLVASTVIQNEPSIGGGSGV